MKKEETKAIKKQYGKKQNFILKVAMDAAQIKNKLSKIEGIKIYDDYPNYIGGIVPTKTVIGSFHLQKINGKFKLNDIVHDEVKELITRAING